MQKPTTDVERRQLLALVGSGVAAGLAGCAGGGDGGDGTTESDAVPEEYRTATSLDGTERDPDSLSAKGDVNYQSEPENGEQCSDCRFYIEDKNDDGMGACAVVEGNIDPSGWCVSYAVYEGGG
ncbi:high-potential iron-sulfur protein [Halobacterium litoreum]|uniref:High-potential iron-sulfur protein n=1 Tax=Halobacterium litoreum TaxID=2039234 RepID=A0ABD5NH32_9EURY|nr:high-potential iron-sulfur protein [Halobacterium litoreum]UHH12845.1 high-potential iron-sulfur protein [Halobacterium litoreum]